MADTADSIKIKIQIDDAIPQGARRHLRQQEPLLQDWLSGLGQNLGLEVRAFLENGVCWIHVFSSKLNERLRRLKLIFVRGEKGRNGRWDFRLA